MAPPSPLVRSSGGAWLDRTRGEGGAMIGNGRIPFLDLVTPHLELEEELVTVFRTVLKTAGVIGGPVVEGVEKEVSDSCGVGYCIDARSVTAALPIALM